MKKKSRDPYVFITAGTKRIGFAISEYLLKKGFNLIVHYRSEGPEVQKLADIAQNTYHRSILFSPGDLTDPAYTPVQPAWKPLALQGIVHNASEYSKGNLFDYNHLNKMLMIHALQPVRITTMLKEYFCPESWVIHLTDANSRKVDLDFQNYRIAKNLLSNLTQQLATLLAPHTRVNAIAPGAMLPAPNQSEEEFKKTLETIPLSTYPETDYITKAIDFLIEHPFITAQTIHVDGGRHILRE